MKNKIKKISLILFVTAFLSGCVSTPTVTEVETPRVVEKKKSIALDDASLASQLEAMGYELSRLEGSSRTLAKSSAGKIVLEKTDSGYTVFRRYTAEKKLTAEERFEMLEIINQINIDKSYQVSYTYDDYIEVAIHIIGSPDAASFAKIVRYLEGSSFLFRANPRMLELLRQ